jgi:hypothetical protein
MGTILGYCYAIKLFIKYSIYTLNIMKLVNIFMSAKIYVKYLNNIILCIYI